MDEERGIADEIAVGHPARLHRQAPDPFAAQCTDGLGGARDAARIIVEQAADPHHHRHLKAVTVPRDPGFLQRCAEAHEQDPRARRVDPFDERVFVGSVEIAVMGSADA